MTRASEWYKWGIPGHFDQAVTLTFLFFSFNNVMDEQKIRLGPIFSFFFFFFFFFQFLWQQWSKSSWNEGRYRCFWNLRHKFFDENENFWNYIISSSPELQLKKTKIFLLTLLKWQHSLRTNFFSVSFSKLIFVFFYNYIALLFLIVRQLIKIINLARVIGRIRIYTAFSTEIGRKVEFFVIAFNSTLAGENRSLFSRLQLRIPYILARDQWRVRNNFLVDWWKKIWEKICTQRMWPFQQSRKKKHFNFFFFCFDCAIENKRHDEVNLKFFYFSSKNLWCKFQENR